MFGNKLSKIDKLVEKKNGDALAALAIGQKQEVRLKAIAGMGLPAGCGSSGAVRCGGSTGAIGGPSGPGPSGASAEDGKGSPGERGFAPSTGPDPRRLMGKRLSAPGAGGLLR